jgi:hypothetical protein
MEEEMPRKLFVVVSLLIFASLMLAACGGSETPAAPAATEAPVATAAPAATEAPAATAATETPAATAAPAATEGSAAPVADAGPAPFPQMAPDSKLDDVVKNMLDQEKTSLAGFNVDMKGYSTTATADDVNAYYKDALKDWTTEKPEDAPAGITFLKWSKGKNAVFVLMTFPMPDGSNGLAVTTEMASK